MDLQSLSLSELKSLKKQIEKEIDGFEDRKLAEARAVLEEKAKELGVSLDAVLGGKKVKTKSAPKYAHPENPTQTWTGRGRQPQWIKDVLSRDGNLDNVAI